jgi:penicillin G amidase
MEKSRRLTAGRLSELFGDKSVNIDKFSLTVGYRKVAQETWDDPSQLSEDNRNVIQAYTNGVNDFITGVGYFHDEITAFYLPPEFYALDV